MKLFTKAILSLVYSTSLGCLAAPLDHRSEDTQSLYDLVGRQLPEHLQGQIEFTLSPSLCETKEKYDCYEITQDNCGGTIRITGASKSALSSGLYRYLRDYGHVSISWSTSLLNQLRDLPDLCPQDGGECGKISGASVVPYRYHFNTVTFGYTSAFWKWENWEHLLDWASLQGINFPLAWVGYEKVLVDVLRDYGFKDEQLTDFLSGPAFWPWNRFGNSQGDWNATVNLLETSLIEDQFALQKQIVSRMVELGMTPILPAFTGFVPRDIINVHPDAKVVNSSTWSTFPVRYTNVTFLDPMDPLFTEIQKSFINKQTEYYGDITKFYTLDQYNENTPASGELDSLKDISSSTIKALKEANPDAVWVMQGWLFHYSDDFWSNERIEAYLSGPEKGELLILDLYSEYSPQWERTKSYHGHDWIWCQLHNFGGNIGMEGSLQILSKNFTEARKSNPNMVGAGLTMESQEGNQIAYDALLYQAWNDEPFDLKEYTDNYIKSYYGPEDVPEEIIHAWEEIVNIVYTNDYSAGVYANGKSLVDQSPALYGLEVKTSRSSIIFYDANRLEETWQSLVNFIQSNPQWLNHPHFHYDIVDVSRQVLANKFSQQYHEFVDIFNDTSKSQDEKYQSGNAMITTIDKLEELLYTDKNFLLSEWIAKARNLASDEEDESVADYLEFQARNQITLWGPTLSLNNYASKLWAGLVGEYYKPTWKRFIDFVIQGNDSNKFNEEINSFREGWQWDKWYNPEGKHESWVPSGTKGDTLAILSNLLDYVFQENPR